MLLFKIDSTGFFFGFKILKSHVKAYEHWVNPAEIETDIKNLLSQFRNLDEL